METHDEHAHDDHARDESIDEIDFVPSPDVMARPSIRPMEPTVFRSIVMALALGAVLGTGIYFFKPTPRGANANPIPAPPVQIDERPAEPVELFELPAWDEAAHQRTLQQR